HRIHSQVRFRHKPARPKRARVVPIDELLKLGIDLMAAAERETTAARRATMFRDGLLVALLALRLLRLRNLVGLVLDRTLIVRGDRWWIDIPASETKSKQWPIEMPWPEILAGQLETYLARHRPVLAAFRRRGAPAAGDALWVSKAGSPLGRRATQQTIVNRTR